MVSERESYRPTTDGRPTDRPVKASSSSSPTAAAAAAAAVRTFRRNGTEFLTRVAPGRAGPGRVARCELDVLTVGGGRAEV